MGGNWFLDWTNSRYAVVENDNCWDCSLRSDRVLEFGNLLTKNTTDTNTMGEREVVFFFLLHKSIRLFRNFFPCTRLEDVSICIKLISRTKTKSNLILSKFQNHWSYYLKNSFYILQGGEDCLFSLKSVWFPNRCQLSRLCSVFSFNTVFNMKSHCII